MTDHFGPSDRRTVKTRFGEVVLFSARDGAYYLLPRHGVDHRVAPQEVNYRANIAALLELKVDKIIATSAVGSINEGFGVGEVGLVDQFIDFTSDRPKTFFSSGVVHTDMTYPYDSKLNSVILAAAKGAAISVHPGLVYVSLDGPRFETAAEVKMLRTLGGDVVGMTGVPEVVFARETGIRYASIVVATNLGAGMQAKVTHSEVLKVMKEAGASVKLLVDRSAHILAGRSGPRS